MSNFAMTYKNQDIVNKAIAFLIGYAIQFSLSYEDKFGKNPKITITCDVGEGSAIVPQCFTLNTEKDLQSFQKQVR